MKIVQDVLSLSLLSSGLVGALVLVNDKWLWSAAPSHAYGLIGFVLIDLILIATALKRIDLAAVGAAFFAALQFGAMLADLVAGAPMGIPSIAFRNYLLSDSSYLGLLFIQIAIAIAAIGTLAAPRIHRRIRFSSLPHFSRR